MTLAKIALAALFAALASFAQAADNAQILTGAELRKIVSGNTIWVLRQDYSIGDEYHVPDGRVFGFNGVEKVDNGCWDIVGNEVCYYYKDDYVKGLAHCWTFKRAGPENFHLTATGTGFRGYGRMDKGNPRSLDDNGKPWECKRLLSRTFSPRNFAAK